MHTAFSLNINGRLHALDRPHIMGILNVTPDSFFDGGQYQRLEAVVQKAGEMLENGADILDIGGYSSRPGAADVSVQEELQRVVEPIKAIKDRYPQALISIDTFRAEVANQAVTAGAHIINDISAGEDDPEMFAAVKELQVPYIMMHKQGSPATMQQNPSYGNVVIEVAKYLSERAFILNEMGVNDLIVDPGFGFGKTVEHNYALLKHLEHFHMLRVPLLVGVSRKSMINKVLGTRPENALNGTTVLNTIAVQKGAHILRVHDVKEARQVVLLCEQLESSTVHNS